LEGFQELDERRLTALADMEAKFSELLATQSSAIKSSSDEFEKSIKMMDPASDVQSWITENNTGQQPDPPFEYEPYISQITGKPEHKAGSKSGNLTRKAKKSAKRVKGLVGKKKDKEPKKERDHKEKDHKEALVIPTKTPDPPTDNSSKQPPSTKKSPRPISPPRTFSPRAKSPRGK